MIEYSLFGFLLVIIILIVYFYLNIISVISRKADKNEVLDLDRRMYKLEKMLEESLFRLEGKGVMCHKVVTRYKAYDVGDRLIYSAGGYDDADCHDETVSELIGKDVDQLVSQAVQYLFKHEIDDCVNKISFESMRIDEIKEKIKILDNIDAVAKFFYGNKDKEVEK